MRSVRLLHVAAFLLAGGPAFAEDGPPLNKRSGLWLTTIYGPTPTVLHECTDATRDAENWRARGAKLPPNCAPADMRRTAAGSTSRMVCRMPAGTTTTDIEMTRTDGLAVGETEAYSVTTHVTIEPHPVQLADGVTIRMESRWTGPCPADMRPGDTTDAAGRRMPRPAE